MVNYKKDNKIKKLNKRNVLLGTMATVLCSVPVSVGITEVFKNEQKTSSNLSNSFSSASENITKHTLENDGAKWKVTLSNGEEKIFDSPEQMRESLLKNSTIKEETYTSNIDLNTLENKNTGIIDTKGNTNVVKGTISENSKTVYGGKDSQVFLDENQAKESYLNVNEAYNFNNLYFENKSDLESYLKNEYIKNDSNENSKINSIVLEGPNGVKSNSINLNSKYAVSLIDSFIENNAKKVFNYKNSTTNDSVNFTKDNFNTVLSSISTKDTEISHIQSNQGESRYVVDNHVNDDYDLIGPYFYKGNLDVGAFMNKNMWKKVDGVTKQVYQQSQVDKIIGSFFSSIINDDNGVILDETSGSNTTGFFRTPLMIGEKPLDTWFLDIIGNFNSSLKQNIINTNKKLMVGKKYNAFYKIPVLYNFILQRLFDLNAPQSVLNDTIFYFKKICQFLQGAIETIVLDKSLLIGKDGKYFNMIELFQIGNLEFDTNTSAQYFLSKVKDNFPYFVGAMSSYMGAVNNIYLFATLLPFDSYDQKYLVDFGIMSQAEFNSNKNKYFRIYDTYSQINFNALVSKFAEYSDLYKSTQSIQNNPQEIISSMDKIKIEKMDKLSLKEYLNSIGTKNALPYQLHNLAIRDELLQYANGVPLWKLKYLSEYTWNGVWEYKYFAMYMLNSFAQAAVWNSENPDFDYYRTYLALIIDSRVNKHPWDRAIQNQAIFINDYELVKSITRLIGVSLATTSLATESIRKIYTVTKDVGSIAGALKNAIKTRWTSFKNLFPRTMRTYTLNASTTFSVRNWSLSNIFSKIGKGIDVLKGAAPIIGTAFLGFEVFVLVFELLKVETTTNFYVYTAADGTEFIWNGGRTVSKYFGFDVQETNGISSMKLVEPIQVTLPQIEEYYYFNGIKYYDPSQAKRAYIEYLVNSEDISNKNFSIKYTFESENNLSQNDSFETLDMLKNKIFESLNINRNSSIIDSSKVNFSSKYVSSISYQYGNISSFDPSKLDEIKKAEFIKNIVNNIRGTYYSKLSQNFESDASIVIPGKVWKSGNIIDNTSKASQYIIDNSANLTVGNGNNNYKEQNKETAQQNSKEALKKLFMEKSTVKNKIAFYTKNQSSILLQKFDNISSNLKEYKVYTVFKPGMGQYQFIDKAKAEKFAMGYKKVEKQYTTTTIYKYGDIIFNSEIDLKNWLIKNNVNY